MKLNFVQRKALDIKPSGRSSDWITPSFGHGCLFKCAYCYMRRNKPEGLSVAQNTDDILMAVENHCESLEWPKPPNQTHADYWTYDFSCNEDFVLHAKYHDVNEIFKYFRNHEQAFGTAATKYVNKDLLDYQVDRKIRIRFSLMPQELSTVMEPKTSLIEDRINAIADFYKAGYDVHVNYSPVIVYSNSKQAYTKLFQMVDTLVPDEIKPKIKAEVIFLTHNYKMHNFNLIHNPNAEQLLWSPEIQENKISQLGGKNIRYNYKLKAKWINSFKQLHQSILPWQKIRYIF